MTVRHAMARSGYRLLLMIVLVSLLGQVAIPPKSRIAAAIEQENLAAPYRSGRILVHFKPTAPVEERTRLRGIHKLRQRRAMTPLDVEVIEVDSGTELETIATLNAEAAVEYAEPDYIYRAYGVKAAPNHVLNVTPNDTLYSRQWGLTQIDAPTAWSSTTGNANVTIAIIDTGVDLTHPDLIDKVVSGYNFVSNNSDPSDDMGHGTHVASIAAGMSNNGLGVTGVAWQAQIMPIKVLGSQGEGSVSDIADGIRWATDNGADILNLSLGSSSNSRTLRRAINYAADRGVFIVAAMGNEYEQGSPTSYPAAYSNVVAVAATDQDDNHASFSSSGSYIDVAAPGVNIWAAVWRGTGRTYDSYEGTSMSTPFVSGTAALLLSVDPNLTHAELQSTLRETAVDVESNGWDNLTGYGRINAAAAVAAIAAPGVTPTPSPVPTATPMPTATPTRGPITGGSLTEQIYLPFVGAN